MNKKKKIDFDVARKFAGEDTKVNTYLRKISDYDISEKGFLKVMSKDKIIYKEGNIYAFKYNYEQQYRFFVIIKEVLGDDGSAYVHVLKYTSDEPIINIDEVGWDNVVTKLPARLGGDEIKSSKEEKYYKLVRSGVQINKEELNFLQYVETDEATNIDKCLDIYNNEVTGEHLLTTATGCKDSYWFYTYLYTYEIYIKYLGEDILDLFKYDNDWRDYIDPHPLEVVEIPEDIMELAYETPISPPANKYQSVKVETIGEEYSYFKYLDAYLLEVAQEIEQLNTNILAEEEMTGENFEILLRYYLKEKEYDLSNIYSDSDTEIISFLSKDKKYFKEVVKEINKFLRSKKKLIKYVKDNIDKIEWV